MKFNLGDEVTGIVKNHNHFTVKAGATSYEADWVINAAGLYADRVDGYLAIKEFTVTPRKGELIVFDKLARDLISHIILPVPSKVGKGVLVSPTVFGNLMLGPTAQDQEDKEDKKEKNKKNREVLYKMVGDNGSYSFIYGKNTIEILPSNKKDKITDIYFHYRSLPDKSIANGNSFDDISSQEFVLKCPKNKYKITFSSS